MKMGPVCSLLFSFDSRAEDTKRTWSPASDGPGSRKFASRNHEKERKKKGRVRVTLRPSIQTCQAQNQVMRVPIGCAVRRTQHDSHLGPIGGSLRIGPGRRANRKLGHDRLKVLVDGAV